MVNAEVLFITLVNKYSSSYPDVIQGKMMSSPALKYKNKVFVFLHKGEMGFRLGPGFDPVKFGLLNARLLSPFKTKPPLKGWFIVAVDENEHWEKLTGMALDYTRTLVK